MLGVCDTDGSELGLEDVLGLNETEGLVLGLEETGVADVSSTNGSSVRKVKLWQLLSLKGYFDWWMYSEPFTLIWKKLFSQVLRILFSENSWHSPASNCFLT